MGSKIYKSAAKTERRNDRGGTGSNKAIINCVAHRIMKKHTFFDTNMYTNAYRHIFNRCMLPKKIYNAAKESVKSEYSMMRQHNSHS